MLLDIELAIISQIKAPLEALGVRLRVTPNKDNSGVSSRGFLVVRYSGSSFSSGEHQKTIHNQQRTLSFELSLTYKDLQTHRDNYRIIETILALLTGFRPINGDGQYGVLYPTNDDFLSNSEGFWNYSIKFALVTDYPNY